MQHFAVDAFDLPIKMVTFERPPLNQRHPARGLSAFKAKDFLSICVLRYPHCMRRHIKKLLLGFMHLYTNKCDPKHHVYVLQLKGNILLFIDSSFPLDTRTAPRWRCWQGMLFNTVSSAHCHRTKTSEGRRAKEKEGIKKCLTLSHQSCSEASRETGKQ